MYWTHELFRMYRRIEHIGSTLSVSTNISIWMSFAVMKIFYLYIDATKRQKTVAGGKIACSHTSSQWTNNFICFVLIFFKSTQSVCSWKVIWCYLYRLLCFCMLENWWFPQLCVFLMHEYRTMGDSEKHRKKQAYNL